MSAFELAKGAKMADDSAPDERRRDVLQQELKVLTVGLGAADSAALEVALNDGGGPAKVVDGGPELCEAGDPRAEVLVLSVAALERFPAEQVQAWRERSPDTALFCYGGDDGDGAELRAFRLGFDGWARKGDLAALAGALARGAVERHQRQRWPVALSTPTVVVVGADVEAWLSTVEAAGLALVGASDELRVLRLLRAHPTVIAIVDEAPGEVDLAQLVASLQLFDPAIATAVVAASAEVAAQAHSAGAGMVSRARRGAKMREALVHRSWQAWCGRRTSDASSSPHSLLVVSAEAVDPKLHDGWVLSHVKTVAQACSALAKSKHERSLIAVLDPIESAEVGKLKDAAGTRFIALTSQPSGDRELSPGVARMAKTKPSGLKRQLELLYQRWQAERRAAEAGQALVELTMQHEALRAQLSSVECKLTRLATSDPVTEVPNRRGIELALSRELESIRRTGGAMAACLVNCDGFRRINESIGIHAGDVALREVAQRLHGVLRATDSIGRTDGDEFLLLLPQTRIAEAMMVAERARQAVAAEPIMVNGAQAHVQVSIGVVVVPWEAASLDDVLPLCQRALEDSKASGRNQVSSGGDSPGLSPAVAEVVAGLVSGEGLRAVAQPIARVQDESVVGYELLARGREGLFEAPKQFLRVARNQGILTAVDMQCLRVCMQQAHLVPAGCHVHVNLFPSTLLDVPVSELVDVFRSFEEGPVCLELSEDQFVGDARELVQRVGALRASGVRLAIDDVGKGRGTLDSVMLLEPEVVKLDRFLISGAHSDVRKERLLRRLVALATTLGCELVGEGVETEEDLALLRELGVPYAQGFLWSKPRALENFTT